MSPCGFIVLAHLAAHCHCSPLLALHPPPQAPVRTAVQVVIDQVSVDLSQRYVFDPPFSIDYHPNSEDHPENVVIGVGGASKDDMIFLSSIMGRPVRVSVGKMQFVGGRINAIFFPPAATIHIDLSDK